MRRRGIRCELTRPWFEARGIRRKSSNVEDAAKLRGKLLLMVGEMDRNVDPASTMQVVNDAERLLSRLSLRRSYVLFPGDQHAQDYAHGKGHTHRLIRMRVDDLVGCLGSFERLLLPMLAGLFGSLQRSGQSSSRVARSFADFAGGCLDQFLGIVSHCSQVFNKSFAVRFSVHKSAKC
jgi:hypothetical protein